MGLERKCENGHNQKIVRHAVQEKVAVTELQFSPWKKRKKVKTNDDG